MQVLALARLSGRFAGSTSKDDGTLGGSAGGGSAGSHGAVGAWGRVGAAVYGAMELKELKGILERSGAGGGQVDPATTSDAAGSAGGSAGGGALAAIAVDDENEAFRLVVVLTRRD